MSRARQASDKSFGSQLGLQGPPDCGGAGAPAGGPQFAALTPRSAGSQLRTARLLVAGLLFFGVAACSTHDGSSDDGDSGAAPGTISRTDLGKKWPLTVDHGTLSCEGSGGVGKAIFTSPDGTHYALNGLAKSDDSLHDIDAIWADDPQMTGLKIDIGPLIDRALKLC